MIADKKNNSKKINLITLKKIGKVNMLNQFNTYKVKKFIKSELIK